MESSPRFMFFHGFNAKETKPTRKSKIKIKMAKVGNAVMLRHNYSIVTTKPQGNKILSQQAELCRNKDKEECKMTVERLSRHFTTLSRHNMRRSTRKMLQHINECHNTMEVGK